MNIHVQKVINAGKNQQEILQNIQQLFSKHIKMVQLIIHCPLHNPSIQLGDIQNKMLNLHRRMNNTLETFLRTLIDKIDILTSIVTEIQSKQKKSNESIKSQKIDLKQLRKLFNDYLNTDIQVIQQEMPLLNQPSLEIKKTEPEMYLKNWMNNNYDLIKDEKQLLEFDQILNNIQVAVAPTGTKYHTLQCNHISKSYKMIGLKQALKQKSHCIDCCKNSKVVLQNI